MNKPIGANSAIRPIHSGNDREPEANKAMSATMAISPIVKTAMPILGSGPAFRRCGDRPSGRTPALWSGGVEGSGTLSG